MERSGILKTTGVLFALCAALALSASAQTLTTLLTFNGVNGRSPGSLVQGANGNLYGTTNQDGANLGGTVFEITTAGTLIGQYAFDAFNPAGGEFPNSGLVQAANGEFYGTTSNGGSNLGGNGVGTVFKIAAGQVITLYSFCSQANCADGVYPYAGLVQAGNGNFYGTTHQGGGTQAKCNGQNGDCGTIFEITPAGQLSTLYRFCSRAKCTDGYYPYAGLVQGKDGNFYGTTFYGGADKCGRVGCGTIFKVTPAGKLTTLYSFCAQAMCTDGSLPAAKLVLGSDGDFYGVTLQGGSIKNCNANNFGCGTVFKITPAGKLTTLHIFCIQENCTDGAAPLAGLVQAANGNFYGTTAAGGSTGYGEVFEITAAGKLTTAYSFCTQTNCADGAAPMAELIQGANGTLYGTTSGDYGIQGYGSVFSLSPQ
jgi:uncharacterized repeat protein (TIGR03803 family)